MLVFDSVLFVFIYLLSFYFVIGGSDWFMVWLGLEINMMMFIMIVFSRYSLFNIESCLKYFFVQSLGSAVFIGILYTGKEDLDFLLGLVLSYKVGAGPFFYWFPSVCVGISWVSCFVLMTFQKILPLMLVSIFVSLIFFLIIFVSLFMGVFGSFNQLNLKMLMAYSSIYHLGWIFLCILINSSYWMNYLVMYMVMVFPVIFYMMVSDIDNLLMVVKESKKMWLVVVMLGMAGMPPFLGFFLKWFAFSTIMNSSVFFMIMLILCSIIMFYVYFRVVYDILVGYFYCSGWGMWSLCSMKKIWVDFFCNMGVLLGIGIGFYFVV